MLGQTMSVIKLTKWQLCLGVFSLPSRDARIEVFVNLAVVIAMVSYTYIVIDSDLTS